MSVTSTLTGDPVRISPSSYNTFVDCNLKWWFNKIAGFPTPTTKSQQLGTDVHSVLEAYLNEGTEPDESTKEGKIASSGIEYLPKPGTYVIEEGVDLQCGTLPFKGYVDAYSYSGHVLDHKTTKDFKWAMDSYQLPHAPQPLAYVAGLVKTGKIKQSDTYKVSFVYYRTTGIAMAQEVVAEVTHEAVLKNWEEMEVAAQTMLELSSQTDPQYVNYNVSTCSKYGKCPFSDICPRNPNNQQLTYNMENNIMQNLSQKDRLAAFLNGEEPQVSPPDAAPTDTPTDAQREEALAFAEAAKDNAGALSKETLVSILRRFQLPKTELPWLKEQLEAKAEKKKEPAKKKKAAPKAKKTAEKAVKTIYVYVDCMPDTGVDTTLEKLAYPLEQEVAAESNVPYYGLIGFGKGKDGVATKLAVKLIKEGANFNSIFVSLRHPVSAQAIALLSNLPNAKVIRGVR